MKIFLYILIFFQVRNSLNLIHATGGSHSFYCFMDPAVTVSIAPEFNNRIFVRKDFSDYPFIIHWLGPRTLHSMYKTIRNLIQDQEFSQSVAKNDTFIFCFGETDCRIHINRQLEKNIYSKEELINQLVAGCASAIDLVQAKFKDLNLKIIISGIIPPKYEYKHLPWVGTFSERLENVILLNKALKEMAEKKGHYFLDIYTPFAGQDGSLAEYLSDGFNHINIAYNNRIWKALIPLLEINN